MKWYVKVGDAEKGPFTLKQLASLLAKEKIEVATEVRAEDAMDWTYAEDIPGLVATARQHQKHESADAGSARAEQADVVEREKPKPTSGLRRSINRRDVLLGTSSLVLFGLLLWGIWYMLQPEPFPETKAPDLVIQNVPRLEQILPPRPSTPTLDIPVGTLTELPGVAQRPWTKCPAMSDNLCELVFIAPVNGQNEIFYSHRSNADAPFEPADAILRDFEGVKDFCSLSPNGLELVFCTYGELNRVWHTTRPTLDDPFQTPTSLSVSDVDWSDLHLDGCRWCGPDKMQLCITDKAITNRSQYLLQRSSSNARFTIHQQVPFANPWPKYAFNARTLRCYLTTETGILMAARRSESEQFITPEVLFDVSTTGAIIDQDYVYAVPNEDILVFASAGPGESNPEKNRLWMLRIH